ncbi:hypothetical protein CgunFtcFv8_013670 [Champsocephalus gunnari]|uniref:Uncharacterized protein n=1 Tax=Champsocephalus gunnari TaxID=52237 RepID=A0AAN8E1S9_CHAGU|nr:hypothetical protein CgunFtcFv8_013670 [Champsocephalus gunnari]
MGSGWGPDAYVVPVYCTHTGTECRAVGQLLEALPDLLQLWTSRQLDEGMPESSDVLHSLVDQSVDRGEGYLKGPGHHTV